MKSSDRGADAARRCLIVDGYNVLSRLHGQGLASIGDLEAERDRLSARMAEYSAVSGSDVILVFDAHRNDEPSSAADVGGIRVVYTAKDETADDRIERLVYELRADYDEITVATSDAAEQQVAFGGGALRISADELIRRVRQTEVWVRERMDDLQQPSSRNRLADAVRQDVAIILERWRRQ
ncbi:MAG: NYN domain-containing protein [Alicyclobacillaceae bacterium]|nr:NYN domain-containing protein [Alicyclobacillaceae bacterium]